MSKKEQFIHIDAEGTKHYCSDRKMTIRHREDGPAIEWVDGDKFWYINGNRHREDGPAVEWSNGDKEWRINDKLHREDGPAIERANGEKFWYINGIKLIEEEEVDSLIDENIKLKADIAEKDKIIEDLRVILEGISEKSDILY